MNKLLARRRDPSRRPGFEGLERRTLLSGAAGPAAPTVRIAATPNDPQYGSGSLWGLSGQNGIQAPAAWDVTTGSPATVTIAVIDTGADYNAPDLYQNVWINQPEIPASRMKNLVDVYHDGYISWRDLNSPANQGPGKITDVNGDGRIDPADILAPMVLNPDGTDSGNGGWANPNNVQDGDTAHPDDLIGWNFVANNNNPLDDSGHGTETMGVIAASGNNGVGVTGVDWSAQVMVIKALDSNGNGSAAEAAAAVLYAARHGARVANASFGSSLGTSQSLQTAIQTAGQEGMALVAAAGNDASNNDTSPFYPASFALPNVLSVAASDQNGRLLTASNYGPRSVDLAAPGAGIETTTPGGAYGAFSGTSAAAAFATGTVALVAGLHPTWTASELVQQVEATVTPDTALAGQVATGGLLDAAAAVGPVAIPLPPAVNWPAPADIVYGTALGPSQLDAWASVPGTFAYAQPAGTVLNAGTGQALSVTFTPNDTQHYAAVTFSTTINVLPASPALTWAPPADIVYGNALGPLQLDASASVPGTFSYSPPLGTVLRAGLGQTLSVTFTPTDSQDYGPAATSTTINVQKATPVINWSPAALTYGNPLGPAQFDATASSPLGAVGGTFTYSPSPGTVLSAGARPLSVVFTPADQSDYNTATGSATLDVARAHLTVTADAKVRARGAANPTFTYTITGLVNGDPPSLVIGSPVLTTPANVSSRGGIYPILVSQGTLSAFNYDFPYLVGNTLTVTGSAASQPGDYDGDGKTDLAVFRPASDTWLIQYSSGGGLAAQFGDPSQGDVPVPGAYEGNGKTDLAVFRPASDLWLIRTSTGALTVFQFGDPSQGDVPVPGDYEGIGKTDLAVYRPKTATWLIRLSTGALRVVQFGDPAAGDIPVPGDYDGDGKTDLAVFRPASDTWLIQYSSGGGLACQFGDPAHHDIPAPGDYDGDGKTDLAVFRPSTGQWLIACSTGGGLTPQFGDPAAGDLPAGGPLTSLGAVKPFKTRSASAPLVAGPPTQPAKPKNIWSPSINDLTTNG